MELRIYYEALEQANHFVKPILESILIDGHPPNIALVRLGKSISAPNEIADILYWKKPDVLVTAVDIKQGTEKVLFMIEFSTAVFTKDHELQRFDNYVPLLYLDLIHIKISPSCKRSPSEIGGDTNFDDDLPPALVYRETGKIVYKFDWKTRDGVLVVDEQHLSCPVEIPEFATLLRNGISNYALNPAEWIRLTNEQNPTYKKWRGVLKRKIEDGIEDVSGLNSSRTRFTRMHPTTGRDSLVVKVNRFGHGMDPERGMIAYYGMVYDSLVTKFVMSTKTNKWYLLANERKVQERVERGLRTAVDFLECFLLATTPPGEMANEVRKAYSGSPTVDIGNIVAKYYERLSKPLRIIFGFSDSITIHDQTDRTVLALTFDRYPIDSNGAKYDITPLKKFQWTEDELTYFIVHTILKQNEFKILSVSYPGAQGDRVMLVQKHTGKSQERKYIDVVMTIRSDIISLLENKKSISQLKTDVRDLKKYKTQYREAVVDFAKTYSDMDVDKTLQIKIGAGFVHGSRTDIKKYPFILSLDYFIAIDSAHGVWKIWHHEPESLFKDTQGAIRLPKTYTAG